MYNEENKNTYEEYLPKLKDFNFFCFTSVDKLIKYISNNLNYFEFRHFYVIVSGRLAESFFNSYLIIADKYNVIADTIVYCYNQKYHETKPYFMDKFLNPGGITLDFENVVNYILKDECDWKNIDKNYQEYIPEKKGYGDVFMNIDTSNEYELALPILISRTINSSLIGKDEITNFQNLLINRYCKSYSRPIMKLIKPSGNKNMNIPLHFLAKFFIKFYTQEKENKDEGQNFYADLNKDLTNDKFDDYHPFIFLIYDCLNKKYLKSYKKKLFRGGKLSKIEFDKMASNFNKNTNKKVFYYSKNFLSFSKDINVAYEFIEEGDDNTVNILFIINECKDENFFVTNIDIESLSSIKTEKEVLNLPLTCFEIIKIGDEETYGKVKYRKLYLNYLDKYQEKIKSKINNLWENNNTPEINNFFIKSINSQFGKSVEKCYKKKEELFVNYAKILNASPDNGYFLSKIARNLMINTKGYSNSKKQTAAHLDDEIGNLINEYKCRDSEDKDTCILQNKITNFIDGKLLQLGFNIENIENGCSIGYCLGNFLSNYDYFRKAPNSVKAFSLASLALACGPHIVKLIPKIKQILETEVINNYLNVGMLLDGLNILWAVSVELFCIFKFHREYYNKNWKLTWKYIGKSFINFGIAFGSSIIGNLAVKAGLYGFYVISGISLAPYVTVVGIIGFVGSGIFGYLGNNFGNYLSEKALGKDEFKLTSANLYYLYIPEKYRKPGNNPHLKWNEIGLTNEVKSYIIECIVNDVETRMRVINIPKNVFELPGCLGYYHDNSQSTDDEDTDCSSDQDGKEKNQKSLKIYIKKKFIGDLVMPYKGIKNNAFKVDFIIYRIKKKKISVKDWINFRDRNSKLNLIHDCFIYSIY